MAIQLKAIETIYKGCRFRSRTEARWAVFYDALGVPWQYEPEGYDLAGVWYLPDFYLPQQDCFIEIKGQEPTSEEEIKADLLAVASGKRVFIFGPIPTIAKYAMMPLPAAEQEMDVHAYFPDGSADYGYLWCQCGFCRTLGIEYSGFSDRLRCCPEGAGEGKVFGSVSDALIEAYAAARGCRFR